MGEVAEGQWRGTEDLSKAGDKRVVKGDQGVVEGGIGYLWIGVEEKWSTGCSCGWSPPKNVHLSIFVL